MDAPVLQALRAWLDRESVAYRHLHHEPTRTSEESARVRGEPLEIGGKALLLKTADRSTGTGAPDPAAFGLFVLSAVLKLDSAAVKARLAVKKVRFAEAGELQALTGLVPGSVPPFGRPILPFDLYIDESITRNARIAFNAGSLTDSIVMTTADYLRLAGGEVFRFGAG